MDNDSNLANGDTFRDYASRGDVEKRIFFSNSGLLGVRGRPYAVMSKPISSIHGGRGVEVVEVVFLDVPDERYQRRVELCLSDRSVSAEELPNIKFKGKGVAKKLVEELNLI